MRLASPRYVIERHGIYFRVQDVFETLSKLQGFMRIGAHSRSNVATHRVRQSDPVTGEMVDEFEPGVHKTEPW